MNKKTPMKSDNARDAGRTMYLRTRIVLPGPVVFLCILFSLILAAVPARGDTPVTLYQSFAGNINITGTGGTLRTQSDAGNSCLVTNSGSMTLSGVPVGATVRAAYLYWAGSGGDPLGGVPADYNVTFNGTAVTADRTFTANGGSTRYFFGGVKDVTSLVTGNGVYTFADLTVQTADVPGGGPYCSVAVVLSAFSLVVVYDDPGEILHVVNLWEGFQIYYGSSITLTPSNFLVPTPAPGTPLSSRVLVLTWEGDSGNSAALGGFNENLTFCSPTPCAGVPLTDAYNPVNNQFNSTIDMPPGGPFSGIDTSWGNDLDMYDITGMIPAGAASAQSVYSSGGDRVILMNQTMSIPNVPVADLAVAKNHAGNFTVGANGVYMLGITNNGPRDATGTITVTDTLPAGLTYSSATGTGWTCGAVGQTVTCTRPGPLANGTTAPSITLTVSVGGAAYPGITNTVSVSSADFDNIAANSTDVGDPTIVVAPDLSTSTKSWVDLSGGDQDPGDTLRYTITIIETGGAAASGVSVSDTVPLTLTGLLVVGCPTGATCSVVGQTLSVSNVSIPPGGSTTVVFDVAIVGGTPVGTLIDNSATITNPVGPGATPAAPTVIVSQSSIPQTGTKPLYLYDATSAPAYKLSRTPMAVSPAAFVAIPRGNTTWTWTLSPALQSSVTVTTDIPVQLWLSTNSTRNYNIPVTLRCGAAVVATQTQTIALTNGAAPAMFSFNLPLAAAYPCPAGSWILTVTNTQGAGGGLRDIRVYPAPSAGNYSKASLPSQNVINVDSVTIYDAGGSAIVTTATGTTVYVRSMISDPFGSYDITSASIIITDPTGSARVNGLAMTQIADSGAATKTYEYAYPVPAGGPAGNWTVRVVGVEGTEGTVSDLAQTALNVVIPLPSLTIVKSALVISDPFGGTAIIPGSVMQYTITVMNSGPGVVDNNSTIVTDAIPANTTMYVDTADADPGDPVTFSCAGCGLSFIYGSNIKYTNLTPLPSPTEAVCANYTYAPTGAYDPSVTGFCVNPTGSLTGGGASFNLYFRVMVK